MSARLLSASLFCLTVLLTGCAAPDDEAAAVDTLAQTASPVAPQPAGDTRYVGVWMRPVPSGIGGVGGEEGMELYADGTFRFIGINTMNGVRWHVSGDSLTLATNTERYPEPFESAYRIESLTDSALVLSGADGLSGTYLRRAAAPDSAGLPPS